MLFSCTYIQALAHVRGSAHFHTPQAWCTVKASAPPGTPARVQNLLVHEAASARRNLDRPLSPRPGHLTPFIIGSLPHSLLWRHHRSLSLSSSPLHLHLLPATCCSWFCYCTALTLSTTFAASAIFCRTLR
ncbi:hypothetical protein V8C35DRAFT_47401 [Trichoderma chlorosporum]